MYLTYFGICGRIIRSTLLVLSEYQQPQLGAKQLDRLLTLRLHDEIDQSTFAAKQMELRDQKSALKLRIEVAVRSRDENADIAVKVFELFSDRRNSCPHMEKALRRSRRRALNQE